MKAFLITGAPGAGKSTVAEALARRLERGAHVPVDFFRKMVKGGYASPHRWNEEVERQYRVARSSAAQTAVNLAEAGFVPVLDDIIPPPWVDEWTRALSGMECVFILLRPPLGVALARNRERPIWTVDEGILRELYDMFERDYTAGWLSIDTSACPPEEAADRIVSSMTR